MTNVYTMKITCVDCENRLWREVKISSNALLCDLGYIILATFSCTIFSDILYRLINGFAIKIMVVMLREIN